jgi:arylsulfatase
VLGIKPPKVVDGFARDPIDGLSLAYTFADGQAPTHKNTQYFENNGSRGIDRDGWFAGNFSTGRPSASTARSESARSRSSERDRHRCARTQR